MRPWGITSINIALAVDANVALLESVFVHVAAHSCTSSPRIVGGEASHCAPTKGGTASQKFLGGVGRRVFCGCVSAETRCPPVMPFPSERAVPAHIEASHWRPGEMQSRHMIVLLQFLSASASSSR